MNTDTITLYYFSPTGGTKAAAALLARHLEDFTDRPVSRIDLTAAVSPMTFGVQDLVFFCFPVYGGRIPTPLADRILQLTGRETPTVLVAVYGNRAIDDALLEMQDLAAGQAFVTVAGVELITPHSLAPVYGVGRPDEQDSQAIHHFVAELLAKLAKAESPAATALPGSKPYREFKGIAFKPIADPARCTRCGVCAAHCPAGAIDPVRPWETNPDACITCAGCVSVCPVHARCLPAEGVAATTAHLAPVCTERREPAFYL